jgi:superfamily II DNA/RNA helicase
MENLSFGALGISAPVERALVETGIDTPFPIQTLVIPAALSGGDVLAKSPTGSGKTLAFALPLVERTRPAGRPTALVLVPTRELAAQVAGTIGPLAGAKGLRTAVVQGGVAIGAQAARSKHADVIVATPGRLHDLMERRLLSLGGVGILVLDEADRMLDLGFRPQVERIMRRLPERRQTLLFSATLDGQVGELARAYTTDPVRFEASGLDVPVDADIVPGDVEHRFVPVTRERKVEALVAELGQDRGLALVFVRTRRGVDRLVRALGDHGVRAAAMHGDLTQRAREDALERFRAGRVTTLVATDVAARGLDLAEITHVINFDPPTAESDYVHRVGRTGRAGRGGNGVTLVLPDEEADMSRVAARLGYREQFERGGLRVAKPRRVYATRGRSRW